MKELTKRLILFFAFVLCSSFTDANGFRFDYVYYAEADGWLKLHQIPANWNEARLKCYHEGAVLASPTTVKLKNTMTSLISNVSSCGIFTGVHATFSRGHFFSIEGVPLARIPIRWAPGEPDNYENSENCLVLLTNGTMADVNCSEVFPYLCYRKKTENHDLNICGTVDPEYNYAMLTQSCYKFHREQQTWSEAFGTCAAEGGYLAIINSQAEADIIKQIFAQNPPNSIIGNFWKDVAHIGFHDWGQHGTWLTIHGQTLKEAGYTKWSGGQPDNATTGEFCGSVFRSGLINDIWCNNRYVFICEKSPHSLLSFDNK